MTKEQIVQLVKDACGLEFSDRTVAMHIGNVFNSIVGQLFASDANQYMFYSKRIIITVDHRTAVVELPLIQNRTNGNGVPRIMPVDPDDTTVFYPSPSYSMNSGVDANKLSSFVFYTVTNSVIRFNKSLPETVTSVLADVIPAFEGYEDQDIISLPQGVAQMIVDGAISAVKGTPSHSNIYKTKT